MKGYKRILLSGHSELVSGSCCSVNGFTLMELLIVVLIIGILAAIALPQYQRAVLKSRYSSLMPTAQAVRDGEEVYYLANSRYTSNVNNLDVKAENTDTVTITASGDGEYAYTLATRPDIKNNLIMYQKHSVNYPGEIHCEALEKDKKANWLCEIALKGTNIGPVLNRKYTTYILQGRGAGLPLVVIDETMNCETAIEMGFTCTVNEDETEKKICKNNLCRIKTLNDDGGYTSVTCYTNTKGLCNYNRYSSTYDKDGNKISERYCQTPASDGSCDNVYNASAYDYIYDTRGNKIGERVCSTVGPGGVCSVYSNSSAYDYTYDNQGNLISKRKCGTVESDGSCSAYISSTDSVDYTYDANGKLKSMRVCKVVESDGACSQANTGYDYIYDARGNMISERSCSTVAGDGSCSKYTAAGSKEYTYDAKGNKTGQVNCSTLASDGSCSAYASGHYYIYDTKGNLTGERICSTVASDKSCSVYNTSSYTDYNYDYSYDSNGNKTHQWRCKTVSSDGTCSAYNASGSEEYVYDTKGNMTQLRKCSGSSLNQDGSCSSYYSTSVFTYDTDGRQMLTRECTGKQLNSSTGECAEGKGNNSISNN